MDTSLKTNRADGVLRYQKRETSRATVRRHFLKWRSLQDPAIPYRCDNPECRFHTETLEWNGTQLKLILDHVNGNNCDNRPKNLQFLCANCDSQLSTRGGANRGRVIKDEGGFALVDAKAKCHFELPAEPGHIKIR